MVQQGSRNSRPAKSRIPTDEVPQSDGWLNCVGRGNALFILPLRHLMIMIFIILSLFQFNNNNNNNFLEA
jgi:hypothetical protein